MSARLVRTVQALRDALDQDRRQGKIIGLVPTMGALHEGHGRLIETARPECGRVVVSIFVNPIQFNRPDDYERYPRTLDTDVRFSEERGADIVFAPEIAEVYPQTQRTFVDVKGLTDHLCGKFRPVHFRGVTTVVAKLFGMVEPDRAYFGQKDAQQLAVIRRMAEDLNMRVEIIAVPTVREASGLALSSRNRLLTDDERAIAPSLYEALCAAAETIARGARDPNEARRAALAVLDRHPQIRLEYLELVDPREMQPVDEIRGPVLAAAAVWLGNTRLIDNVMCGFAARS
jgi:pantoate--beta-alanine ligase